MQPTHRSRHARGARIVVLSTLFLFAAVCLSPAVARSDVDRYRSSVVQVSVVMQGEDYARPWQRPRPSGTGGSAFYIGDKRLMTNAHVVSDAKSLLVKRADRAERYEARVVHVGHDCDLSLLTVDDDSFWEGMEPLEIGDRPEMRSKVAIIGYPTGGRKLSVTEGVVSRIELHTYVHTGTDQHLTIQTDAAINPGNSGGPVIQDGKVVGVTFQLRFYAQNIGYMIPPSVIRHFLRDVEDGTYHGYPKLGLYTANLENEGLRRFLGVPEGETGVVVLKPTPYASCVGLVKRNDVLHAIDGHPVQQDGTVRIGSEFFDFAFVVENKQIGDVVTLTLRREGELIEVPVTLEAWGARMKQATAYNERPEYLVLGGHVFVPFTANYLQSSRRSEELNYYVTQYYRTVAKEGETREQLVLLSRVLPHASTRYIEYQNAIVESVDGQVPNDFAHFVRLIDDAEENLVKITFEGVNRAPLILDRAAVAKVHAQILEENEIAEDRFVKGGE